MLGMAQKQGKKRLFIFIFPFLLFFLMISPALSINNTFCLDKISKNRESLNVCLTTINHTVDWLAVNTNTLRRAHRTASSQLHGGLLHIVIVTGIFFSVSFINKLNILSTNNLKTINPKKTFLLKLRI